MILRTRRHHQFTHRFNICYCLLPHRSVHHEYMYGTYRSLNSFTVVILHVQYSMCLIPVVNVMVRNNHSFITTIDLFPSMYLLSTATKNKNYFQSKDREKKRELSTEGKCHEPVLMSCCDENTVCPLNFQKVLQAQFHHQNEVVLYNSPLKRCVCACVCVYPPSPSYSVLI